ncbi:hypothetical protein AB0M43_27690 [Longispora sp. NPDC051575]|uniref:hypothetical protein n=1 Tax=Longispora sp. NPDC051575 TaxID=3154943 RepID=UPI00341F9E61
MTPQVPHHPAPARRGRIGRPDLPQQYDDGGLVDVNHLPTHILTSESGLHPDTAELIIRQRTEFGGPSTPDELIVHTGLAPAKIEMIRDRLIFQPLDARPPLPTSARAHGFGTTLQGLLSVEGNPVVSRTDNGRAVRLDVALLREQFQI